MENQIYRLRDGDGGEIEFWTVDTNDINPHKDVKEHVITFSKSNNYYDFVMEENAVRSLIKFLAESLEYVSYFNKNSKVKEEN